MTGLTMEQEFSLKELELRSQEMSEEQLREFIVYIYRQMLIQRNATAAVLKHNWGISD